MKELVTALGCIYVFEGSAVRCRLCADLDPIQNIKRHFPTPRSHRSHPQAKGPGCQTGIRYCTAQAIAIGSQVTRKVTQNEIVHRAKGDKGMHK